VRSAELGGAALASLLAASLLHGGCGRGTSAGARRGSAAGDSSFAALTLQRGRLPLELSLGPGRAVYERYCAICHGETGGGDGFNAYNVTSTFDVTPTALADSAVLASIADSTALEVIRHGGAAAGKSAAMPPWGNTLTPGEVIDVWRYVRSLPAASREE
jgi:mono/diheme cytochrome c family protein